MTNRDFDRISRPERDALDFIQRQMGELALVKTRVVDIMAGQMAQHIRWAESKYTEAGRDGDPYKDALDHAQTHWGSILSQHRTQD